MWRRILLLSLLWLAPVLGWTAPAPQPHVILVMGDSLSAAYNIDPAQGWVNLLQQRLESSGYDYTVVNASISGETTSGGLTRLPGALKEHGPGIVIIELGANDGLRGLPLKVLHDDLTGMILASERAGAKVLLVGMLLPPNYGGAYTQSFAQTYKDLARRYKLPFVPFLLRGIAENRDMMQADGLHPVAGAEPRVLENVWPYLEPLLHKKR
ncbi:MAG TPA: arylesterase [Gammaproteobacteria bacterium]|nr:arylesterase [Gammaproteobacteria bacterium]